MRARPAVHSSGRVYRLRRVRTRVPVTAIFPEEDVPGNMKQYIQLNREVFKSDAPPGKPQK